MQWSSIVFACATVGALTLRPVAALQNGCGDHARASAFATRRVARAPDRHRTGDVTESVNKAVLAGLRWLARHQNPDGSWGADRLSERCDPSSPCFKPQKAPSGEANEGLTGLALQAFLGAGFGPDSPQEIADSTTSQRPRAGQVVAAGLQWLGQHQPKDGWFASGDWSFDEHAIVTTALCEASGMSGDPALLRAAKQALGSLLRAQAPCPLHPGGKWGWSPNPSYFFKSAAESGDGDAKKRLYESDMISTSWAISALNSARLAGLTVDSAAIDGALEFARFATANDGLVGYDDAKRAGITLEGKNDHYIFHVSVFSAQGMWVRMLAAHDPSDAFLDLAAKRIVADLPAVSKDKLSIDYTYWYWGSLALWNCDGPDSPRKSGKYWNPWNKAMLDAVLSLQDRTEHGCSNGGWIILDRWAYIGGPLYTTAMNVLTLETYTRYENAFNARVDEFDTASLAGWTDDEFQAATKSVREAASRKSGELTAEFDDALAYYREVAVSDEKTPDAASRRMRRELSGFGAREVVMLVEGLVRHDPEASLKWLIARTSAPDAERTCSKWMLDQVQVAARAAANTRLGTGPERARRQSLLQVDADTALVYARHGTLQSLREMLTLPVADALAAADSLDDFDAHLENTVKYSKAPEVLRAVGQMTRAESGAKARIDELGKPRVAKEWWRSARGLADKLSEMNTAGLEEMKLVGLERKPAGTPPQSDDACPPDLAALQAESLKLGTERFVERTLLGRFLTRHPEIVFVPLSDCRMALFDTGSQNPGIVLAAATFLEPYMKVVPR